MADDKITDHTSPIAKLFLKEAGYDQKPDFEKILFWNENWEKVRSEIYAQRASVTSVIKRAWTTRTYGKRIVFIIGY